MARHIVPADRPGLPQGAAGHAVQVRDLSILITSGAWRKSLIIATFSRVRRKAEQLERSPLASRRVRVEHQDRRTAFDRARYQMPVADL
jgi:hypothetical protein